MGVGWGWGGGAVGGVLAAVMSDIVLSPTSFRSKNDKAFYSGKIFGVLMRFRVKLFCPNLFMRLA